jgi:hypothetical protein
MRRQRFTAHLAGVSAPAVILAYSAESVREHYARRGHTVISIERGDHRLAERKARREAAYRERDSGPDGGGFRIDQGALRDACELLGIRLPVRVRYHSRVGGCLGNHRLRAEKRGDGHWHDIMLKSYLSAEKASRALWHELTHAAQAERAGGTLADWAREHRRQVAYSYSVRPIEREARDMEVTMADVPLAVSAQV